MNKKVSISCCKASELVEKKNLSSLSVFEIIQLKVHEIICKGCKAYEKQSMLLEEGAKRILEKNNKSHKLSKETKEEIISKIKN